MGVAGSGKTSIASALARQMGWPFIEADEHHSIANKTKMAAGTPLTDEDRASWVDSMCAASSAMPEPRIVLACSALTPFVQAGLREGSGRRSRFVMLDVPKAELARRIAARADHFMPVSLLDSQLEALSVPEDALRIAADRKPEDILADIVSALEAEA
ncbi:gluconokinase [Hyphomonas pacifica]|nr:gluconokinase, GntK/IdnK-type [Hyphomonas pacifica]